MYSQQTPPSFTNPDAVAAFFDLAAGEGDVNSLAREGVTGPGVEDRALLVAYLALLRQLQQHVVADLELRAKRQRHEIDALGGDVLGEIAFLHI